MEDTEGAACAASCGRIDAADCGCWVYGVLVVHGGHVFGIYPTPPDSVQQSHDCIAGVGVPHHHRWFVNLGRKCFIESVAESVLNVNSDASGGGAIASRDRRHLRQRNSDTRTVQNIK